MINPTKNRPRVSVCVPTYNGASYLKECLDSITAQTLTDFEVVIVDDASTDATCEIAAEFARRDPRFRVLRNIKRLGLVGNWTRSIEASHGEWIKLLFQDDLLKPACLARLVEGCERLKLPFGFCQRDIIFDDVVDEVARQGYVDHQARIQELYQGHEQIDGVTFARWCADFPGVNLVGEPTVTLMHRSVFNDFGTFNPALVQICDMEYWARVGCNTGIAHVAESLAVFRVHGASTTSQNEASRRYHKGKLDPLIFRYVVLHDPHCRGIRAALYSRPGRLDAWWRCLYAAQEVWRMARPNLFHSRGSDMRMMEDWRAAAAVYPRLQMMAWLGFALVEVRKVVQPSRRRA